MDNVSKFTDFLCSKGYNLIENNEKLHFVIYENDGLFVRVVKEADGKHFIDLSRANNHGWQGWYDMGLIRFFIKKAHYEAGGPVTFDPLSEFFVQHYDEIMEAFTQANFRQTEKKLAILKNERAQALFGYGS